jgi:hypothetical protein
LMYVAIFSVPIGYLYLLGTAVYSVIAVPFILNYLYFRCFDMIVHK